LSPVAARASSPASAIDSKTTARSADIINDNFMTHLGIASADGELDRNGAPDGEWK
jgi:hypothetical protein